VPFSPNLSNEMPGRVFSPYEVEESIADSLLAVPISGFRRQQCHSSSKRTNMVLASMFLNSFASVNIIIRESELPKLVRRTNRNRMKLHLGCFDQRKPGWYNTDITPHLFVSRIPFAATFLHAVGKMNAERLQQHRDGVFGQVHYLNVSKRFPWKDNSAEAVFSSHMIEHLHPSVAKHMLSESLRVLKPGGVCRIVAPSLRWALSMYCEKDPSRFLAAFFEHDHTNPKNRHMWMYTEQSLSSLMSEVGFTDVSVESFQKGRLPDLEQMDNRPENSIYVEGLKGETTV
jgi:predicted SAM-dependent methyltransferase